MILHKLFCLFFYCPIEYGVPEVKTINGIIRGRAMLSRSGRTFLAFRGIPYARPPVGALRFKDPEPTHWKGILEAVHPGPPCVQWNHLVNGPTLGHEDCLYLSVFTPVVNPPGGPDGKLGLFHYLDKFKTWKRMKLRKWKLHKGPVKPHVHLLPVIVYIHGGCFEFGAGDALGEGPEYFMDELVVLVKINYRLGALGFLSFEDNELPGNMGLKDQVLALRWVKQNIASFGGDPHRVTIIGDDAGAASAHLHLLSPMSRGLFHQAVVSSGSGFSPWAMARGGRARATAIKTAALLGCLHNSTSQMVHCLRTKEAHHIIDQRRALISANIDPVCMYVPVIDWKAEYPFLPDELHLLHNAKVDVMFGVNSADGLLKTAFYARNDPFDWSTIDYFFPYYIKDVLLIQPQLEGCEEEIQEVRTAYFGDQEITEHAFPNLTNLFTDAWFVVPMIKAFQHHAKNAYLYYFDYVGENSYANLFGSRRMLNGACHGDENIYLFNSTYHEDFLPLYGKNRRFSMELVQVWTDFARFGDPGRSQNLIIGDWRHQHYLSINNDGFFVKEDFLMEVINFWLELNIIR